MNNRKKRRKMSRKRRKTPWASVILVGTVVTVMMCGVWISTSTLNTKLADYHERENVLKQQISAEQERAEDIEEYAKYVQTNAYVEEIAKEKLGLVFEDEIIFKKED